MCKNEQELEKINLQKFVGQEFQSCVISHFRVVMYLFFKASLVHSFSYENEFSFTCR